MAQLRTYVGNSQVSIYSGNVAVKIGNGPNNNVTPEDPNTYMVATGGTITTSGSFKYHTFTTGSYNFNVTTVPTSGSEIMIVGGGGGGGNTAGGGGGAGGFFYTSSLIFSAQTYTVIVGDGAPGVDQSLNQYPAGYSGSLSLITGSDISITTFGGGGGGSYNQSAAGDNRAGANSGGANGYGTQPLGGGAVGTIVNATIQPSYLAVYNSGSYVGGLGANLYDGAGGGGGATQTGFNGIAFCCTNKGIGGDGGRGIINPITGSIIGEFATGSYWVAGGGGGSGHFSGSTYNLGGVGGGGKGGSGDSDGAADADAQNGTANTGGGGGGVRNGPGATSGIVGKAGGSGVVVIRYQFQT